MYTKREIYFDEINMDTLRQIYPPEIKLYYIGYEGMPFNVNFPNDEKLDERLRDTKFALLFQDKIAANEVLSILKHEKNFIKYETYPGVRAFDDTQFTSGEFAFVLFRKMIVSICPDFCCPDFNVLLPKKSLMEEVAFITEDDIGNASICIRY